MAIYKSSAAAAAKARMAKRGRRQRFWKENKRRILIISLTLFLILLAAVMTPFGPDYYYGKIQNNKWASPGVLNEGYMRDMYKLGVFYQNTMRKNDAKRIYDEMAQMYYGFKFSEYAVDPDSAFEKRLDAETRIKRGLLQGPPYKIPASEEKYIGLAIWRMGETLADQSRQFVYRLYNDLYLEEFMDLHPRDADPDVTKIVQGSTDRFMGRR